MVITTSGTIATFKTHSSKPIQSLKAYFGPIQSGSGDPSPTNIRTLNGRNEISVIACGKNLFNNISWYDSNQLIVISHGITFEHQENGAIISNGTADGSAIQYLPINYSKLPAGNYYSTMGIHNNNMGEYPFAWNGNTSSRLKKWNSITDMDYIQSGKYVQIQIPANTNQEIIYLAARHIANTTASNKYWYPAIINSVENPDNISWEPYNARNLTINWTDTAGEVAGGYVDLITGELVVTHKKYIMDGNDSWAHPNYFTIENNQTTVRFLIGWSDTKFLNGDSYFDQLTRTTIDNNQPAYTFRPYQTYANNIVVSLPFGGNDGIQEATTESAEAWLRQHPIEFVTTIKTPITYQLNSQQLSTLVGRNNIWGVNCDKTEVSYEFEEILDMTRIRQKVLNGCQIYKNILPPGYKEYDWLQTSGHNTRIDTGISGDNTTLKIQSSFTPINLVNSYSAVFGNYKTENDNYCWRIICIANTNQYYKGMFYYTAGNGSPGGGGTGGIYPTASNIEALNRRVDFTMTYGQVTYTSQTRTDNATVTITNMSKNANTNNIAIGASNTTSTGGTTKFHIYRFKIWSHDKLVRDYHPCIRLSDNKAGFYDMVNYTFNPSIGSVNFIAGNDIGGLYVYQDNARYASSNNNNYVDDEITSDSDFFLTGFYDTGSENEKSFTITCNPFTNINNRYSVVRFYNDKTSNIIINQYYIGQNYASRTVTSSGRYLMCSVYKPNAANFYIYDNTNKRYIIKGSNVT